MYKVVDTLPSVVAQNFWTAPLTFEISLQCNTLLCSVNASGRKSSEWMKGILLLELKGEVGGFLV